MGGFASSEDDPAAEAELIRALWHFIGSGALRVVTPGVEHFPPGMASDQKLRQLAARFGQNADEMVRLRHQAAEWRAAVPATETLVVRRLRDWAVANQIDPGQLIDYWKTRWCRTSSPPPFPRPELTEVEQGFWPHELAEYEPILARDYDALDPRALLSVIEEAEYFISPLHLRYFAPALAEHLHRLTSVDSRATDADEKLVKALQKALPLPNPRQMAEALARAVQARPIGLGDQVGMNTGWRQFIPLLFDLGAPDLATALLASDQPSVAYTVAEYANAVVSSQLPLRPEMPLDALIVTMERIARLPDRDASLYARVVLGTASHDELRRCRDPACPVHGRRR